MVTSNDVLGVEKRRLIEDAVRTRNWKRWGPYLSERQWGTVREDYSADGSCWTYFPHDHARSRAYRWGEDGLLGITDRECRLSFALALWNGRDPILKERLFGLTNPEGNHGEDVKECYFYLDSLPSHSYVRSLYKYPQREFPYRRLIEENRIRGRDEREFELTDTGIFDDNRYFDIFAEYAKASPNDILIRVTVANRGNEEASLRLLPTVWFRNTWSWGRTDKNYWPKPRITKSGDNTLVAEHASLGRFFFAVDPPDGADQSPLFLFTYNETNVAKLFGGVNQTPYVKDAFHEFVIHGRKDAVSSEVGTKAAPLYQLRVAAQEEIVLRFRLFASDEAPARLFGEEFDETFAERAREADEFYDQLASGAAATTTPTIAAEIPEAERRVVRQAYAGLLHSKQFYHYDVREWIEGDPAQPPPPASRNAAGRNVDWKHLVTRDVVSMPDKWEYPWFAAWDLAFHMLPIASVDPEFAKRQITLLLREWYMHPSGQLPAYEFAFSDVNPPVHAWAAWRVYKISEAQGQRDRSFLERVFHKLLINFTWWVNRKDVEGNHIFAGGFLGLDNIGVFDRSQPLASGAQLDQADGTAWMAFYCGTMLSIALELAGEDETYEDVASKFFEHFIHIIDAINTVGGSGLWNEEDGFYYDELIAGGETTPLRLRSLVGLIPLIAVEILEADVIARLPSFSKRMRWLLENRADLAHYVSLMDAGGEQSHSHRLLAIPSRERLERLLRYLLDENEFLSPFGIRSLSRVHRDHPYVLSMGGSEHKVEYTPGESRTSLFGGNSNWRGPVWFPINYLLVEALERYGRFYGDNLRAEFPTGSGRMLNLTEVAREIAARLARIFLPDENKRSPWQGDERRFAEDPHWCNLTLFHEYFHGDTGRGLGASHQTGWTALVARLIEDRWRRPGV